MSSISERRAVIRNHPDYEYSSRPDKERRYHFKEGRSYSFAEAYRRAVEGC